MIPDSGTRGEDPADRTEAWDVRVAALVGRLPDRVARAVRWLRDPSRRMVRTVSGLLLFLGGCLSILPVLGLWMLPLGLALLADDWPALKPKLEGAALFVERSWGRFRRP